MRLGWIFFVGVLAGCHVEAQNSGTGGGKPEPLPPTATKRGERPSRLDNRVAFQRFVNSQGGRLGQFNKETRSRATGGWRPIGRPPVSSRHDPFPRANDLERPLSHPAVLERPKKNLVSIPSSKPAAQKMKAKNPPPENPNANPEIPSTKGPASNSEMTLTTKNVQSPNALPSSQTTASPGSIPTKGPTATNNVNAENIGKPESTGGTSTGTDSGRKMTLAESFSRLHSAWKAIQSQTQAPPTAATPGPTKPASDLTPAPIVIIHRNEKPAPKQVISTHQAGFGNVEGNPGMDIKQKHVQGTPETVYGKKSSAQTIDGQVKYQAKFQSNKIIGVNKHNSSYISDGNGNANTNNLNSNDNNINNGGVNSLRVKSFEVNNAQDKNFKAQITKDNTHFRKDTFNQKQEVIGTGRAGPIQSPVSKIHPPVLTRDEVGDGKATRSGTSSGRDINGTGSRAHGLSGRYSSYSVYVDSQAVGAHIEQGKPSVDRQGHRQGFISKELAKPSTSGDKGDNSHSAFHGASTSHGDSTPHYASASHGSFTAYGASTLHGESMQHGTSESYDASKSHGSASSSQGVSTSHGASMSHDASKSHGSASSLQGASTSHGTSMSHDTSRSHGSASSSQGASLSHTASMSHIASTSHGVPLSYDASAAHGASLSHNASASHIASLSHGASASHIASLSHGASASHGASTSNGSPSKSQGASLSQGGSTSDSASVSKGASRSHGSAFSSHGASMQHGAFTSHDASKSYGSTFSSHDTSQSHGGSFTSRDSLKLTGTAPASHKTAKESNGVTSSLKGNKASEQRFGSESHGSVSVSTGAGSMGLEFKPHKTNMAEGPASSSGGPIKTPCRIAPICGSDGFTYMSECFLAVGVTAACEGFCPCKPPSETPKQPQPPNKPGFEGNHGTKPSDSLKKHHIPVDEPRPHLRHGTNQKSPNPSQPTPRPLARPPFLKRRPVGLKPPPPPQNRGGSNTDMGQVPLDKAPVCACPLNIDPVCGINGRTYDNDCLRRCAYVGLECQGQCPCAPGSPKFSTVDARSNAYAPGSQPTNGAADTISGDQSGGHLSYMGTATASGQTGSDVTYTVQNERNTGTASHITSNVVVKLGAPSHGPSRNDKASAINTNSGHNSLTHKGKVSMDVFNKTGGNNSNNTTKSDSLPTITTMKPVPGRESAEVAQSKKQSGSTRARGTKTKSSTKPKRKQIEIEPVEKEVEQRPQAMSSSPTGHQDPLAWLMYDSTGFACFCSYIYEPVCGTNGITYNNYCSLTCDNVPEDCVGECPCTQTLPHYSASTTQGGKTGRSNGNGTQHAGSNSNRAQAVGNHNKGAQATGSHGYGVHSAGSHGNGAHAIDVPVGSKPYTCADYCPAHSIPVCSTWGHTFENDCIRDCSGEPFDCEGVCPCPHDVYRHNPAHNTVSSAGPAHDPFTGYDTNVYPDVNNEPSNQPVNTCNCGAGDIDPVCTIDGQTLWYGCMAICQGATIACSSECPC